MIRTLLPTAFLLAQSAPISDEEAGGDLQIVGYAIVVAGVLDLLVALFLFATGRIADEQQRLMVCGALALGGFTMIGVGIAVALGMLG